MASVCLTHHSVTGGESKQAEQGSRQGPTISGSSSTNGVSCSPNSNVPAGDIKGGDAGRPELPPPSPWQAGGAVQDWLVEAGLAKPLGGVLTDQHSLLPYE